MNKNTKILLIIIAVVVVALVIFIFWGSAGQDKSRKADNTNQEQSKMETIILPGGLQIMDEVLGSGDQAAVGNTVVVNYVGTLTDGKKFDSSYDRGQPFSFRLGTGQVIMGWDQGILGMKVGGKRKLIIPPSLGYGSQSVGSIPANSTLIFEVELLGVQAQ